MENILITGGTGFIGSQLVPQLEALGHKVFILTRQEKLANKNEKYIHWKPKDRYVNKSVNDRKYTIINLAGENIANERWTDAHKQRVIQSRTDILNTLFMLCNEKRIESNFLVSASAIGYYGNNEGRLTEETPGDNSFLSEACQAWEAAALQFESINIKTSIVRIGIVLGNEQGAFPKLIATLPFKFVGIPGNGKQIFPWIHLQDVVSIFLYLFKEKKYGIFNAVAPETANMNEIFKAIKVENNYWIGVHAPAFALKIIMGELAIEVLKSSNVSAEKLVGSGFKFEYGTLASCMNNLLS